MKNDMIAASPPAAATTFLTWKTMSSFSLAVFVQHGQQSGDGSQEAVHNGALIDEGHFLGKPFRGGSVG